MPKIDKQYSSVKNTNLDTSIIKDKKNDKDLENSKIEKANFVNEFMSFDEALKVLIDHKFPDKFI